MTLELLLKNLEINLPPNIRYLELLTENGGVAMGSDDFISLDRFVRRAILRNKDYLIQYALSEGFDHWDEALIGYARKGNKEMVDFY